jgi:hypothetical protein
MIYEGIHCLITRTFNNTNRPLLKNTATVYCPVSGGPSMPYNAVEQQAPVNSRFNAHSVTKATGIPCHVDTEAAPSARTMKSVNGWTVNKKSYCLLTILWQPLPCPAN